MQVVVFEEKHFQNILTTYVSFALQVGKCLNIVFVVCRWIYSLDSNRLQKKYKQLSDVKRLKGTSCKLVGNEQFEDMVDTLLEKCGLSDEEDRIYVMKEMKQLSLPNPLAICE